MAVCGSVAKKKRIGCCSRACAGKKKTARKLCMRKCMLGCKKGKNGRKRRKRRKRR